jgi:hypothetical protein
MKYETLPCVACNKTSIVDLTDAEALALEMGSLIQDALPNRDAAFWGLVLTGLHAECHMPMCLCPVICLQCGHPMGGCWRDGCESCYEHHFECVHGDESECEDNCTL